MGRDTNENKGYKRAAALLLGCILAVVPCLTERAGLFDMVGMASERTASVNATNLNVRSGLGTSYQAVARSCRKGLRLPLSERDGRNRRKGYGIRSGSAEAAVPRQPALYPVIT